VKIKCFNFHPKIIQPFGVQKISIKILQFPPTFRVQFLPNDHQKTKEHFSLSRALDSIRRKIKRGKVNKFVKERKNKKKNKSEEEENKKFDFCGCSLVGKRR
jgi:hypothetical protein